MQYPDPSQNPLSEDPDENQRLENEILKLKLQAERGAQFGGNADRQIDPETEAAFLKHVEEYESAHEAGDTVTVYDYLKQPQIVPLAALTDDALEPAMESLGMLLIENGLMADFGSEEDPREQYRFLSEAFMQHPISAAKKPDVFQVFMYESFHPPHKKIIEEGTRVFLRCWSENNFEKYPGLFGPEVIAGVGGMMPLTAFKTVLNAHLSKYAEVGEAKHKFLETKLQLDGELLMGHVEGLVKFEVQRVTGERDEVRGPFIVYWAGNGEHWQIMSFRMPEFEW